MVVINKLTGPGKQRQAGSRIAYVAPTLKVFGPVGALTQGGTIGKNEGNGTPALDTNGRGIFTDALIQVLAQAGDQPLTYAQLARQVPPLVAASSYQIPYFHGDLNEPVFGNDGRTRPVAWEVAKVGPPLELSGPPLPGIGEGAELRIYDGALHGADTRDPGKAKATAISLLRQ